MPRLRTVALLTGGALLARRALRSRIKRSPLWPMPPLAEPISGVRRHQRPTTGLRLTVAERTEPAEGVVQLRLTADYGSELPAWEPGAHIDLVLPSGLVRQYSLCGDPADTGSYTIATRLVENSRGGSREVHEQLFEATEVDVRGPRNRFPLVDAPAYLFVAGGIGITPILPMVYAAESAGVPWRLLYGGRSRATMPFLAELAKLDDGNGRVTIVPQDEDGLPDLTGSLRETPADAAVYCCGPDALMDAVADLCAAEPPGGALHMERFSLTTVHPSAEDQPFEAELRHSGHTVHVPADSTLLAAIRSQALPGLPYSCEQGFCGTCQQRVLAGEIDHRDELLTDAERDDSMLICVSRARGGRLVLDL
ncbi:PDR/VanB family oxidoreductase [Streptomyces gobiensis]|uniref:PDR/VanB family oxidoreductase n=1 Tax=Streptomyces gobiensis TaxID=2875706 RepID=UPI001E4ACC79|nr:PDR/VanB family oxidoreductase [Streptomyces gobiensis]UGY91033.1 PDR/VanB family oxidoreductase [Streptomyces gobiensis]